MAPQKERLVFTCHRPKYHVTIANFKASPALIIKHHRPNHHTTIPITTASQAQKIKRSSPPPRRNSKVQQHHLYELFRPLGCITRKRQLTREESMSFIIHHPHPCCVSNQTNPTREIWKIHLTRFTLREIRSNS